MLKLRELLVILVISNIVIVKCQMYYNYPRSVRRLYNPQWNTNGYSPNPKQYSSKIQKSRIRSPMYNNQMPMKKNYNQRISFEPMRLTPKPRYTERPSTTKTPTHFVRFMESPTMRPNVSPHFNQRIRNLTYKNPFYPRMRKQNSIILPVIDPDEGQVSPFIIYAGDKAELVFNTIMDTPTKPHEPSQVMQPPADRVFSSMNLWNQYSSGKNRFNHHAKLKHDHMLTEPFTVLPSKYIPFYAHEALITPTTYRAQVQPTTEASLPMYYFHQHSKEPNYDSNLLINYDNYATTERPSTPPVIYGNPYPNVKIYPAPSVQQQYDETYEPQSLKYSDKPKYKNPQIYQSSENSATLSDQKHSYSKNNVEVLKSNLIAEISSTSLEKDSHTVTGSTTTAPSNYVTTQRSPISRSDVQIVTLEHVQSVIQNTSSPQYNIVYAEPQPPETSNTEDDAEDQEQNLNRKHSPVYSAKLGGFQSSFELPITTLNKIYRARKKSNKRKYNYEENSIAITPQSNLDMDVAESRNIKGFDMPIRPESRVMADESSPNRPRCIEVKQKFSNVAIDPNMSWISFGPKTRTRKPKLNAKINNEDNKLSSSYIDENPPYRSHFSPRSEKFISKSNNSRETVLGARLLVDS